MDAFTLIVGGGILFYALTCLAIVDIATKDFSSIYVKAAWGFAVFVPFVGCLLYFAFGYRLGIRKKNMAPDPESGVDTDPGIG